MLRFKIQILSGPVTFDLADNITFLNSIPSHNLYVLSPPFKPSEGHGYGIRCVAKVNGHRLKISVLNIEQINSELENVFKHGLKGIRHP